MLLFSFIFVARLQSAAKIRPAAAVTQILFEWSVFYCSNVPRCSGCFVRFALFDSRWIQRPWKITRFVVFQRPWNYSQPHRNAVKRPCLKCRNLFSMEFSIFDRNIKITLKIWETERTKFSKWNSLSRSVKISKQTLNVKRKKVKNIYEGATILLDLQTITFSVIYCNFKWTFRPVSVKITPKSSKSLPRSLNLESTRLKLNSTRLNRGWKFLPCVRISHHQFVSRSTLLNDRCDPFYFDSCRMERFDASYACMISVHGRAY